MFYHVTCREAAEQPGSTHHHHGLARGLEGLADRLAAWLQDMKQHQAEELQQLQCEVMASLGQLPQLQDGGHWQQQVPSGGSSSSRWDAEVLWWLQHNVLFHTSTPHKYDHQLLDDTAMALFGFQVRRQQEAAGGRRCGVEVMGGAT